jgi:O-antigen/teichoic acid export membrane protein
LAAEHARDLKRETAVYGAAMVVSGLVQLAFLPFISSYLSPEAAGELGALRATAEAVAGIVVLGLPTALVRAWHRTEAHRSVILRGVLIPLFPAALAAGLMLLLRGPLADFLQLAHPDYLLHALALGVGVAYMQVALSLPRARGMAWTYFLVQLVRGLLALGLLAVLVYAAGGGVAAFLTARWAPSFLMAAAAFALVWRRTPSGGDPGRLTSRLLAFGLPLVPASLAMIVLSSADIYMLRHIYPALAASGHYEWASRACLVLTPLTLGFNMAWHRFIFRKRRDGGSMGELGRMALLFMVVVNWAAMLLAMAAPEIAALVGGGEYYPAHRIIPWLAGAGALYALYIVSQTGPLLAGRTKIIAAMTAFGAVLNIIFNLRLIPVAGGVGAAFATLATDLFMALSLFWLGRKLFPISILAVAAVVIPPVALGPLATMGSGGRAMVVLGGSLLCAAVLGLLRAAGASLGDIGEGGENDDG